MITNMYRKLSSEMKRRFFSSAQLAEPTKVTLFTLRRTNGVITDDERALPELL